MKFKRSLISITVILLGIGLMVSQLTLHSRDTGLQDWYDGVEGYKVALMEQSKTKKPLALFFHADWCKSCKSLRESVLSAPEVKQYMSGYIRVKIEPEKSSTAKNIANNFGVLGYPTVIILPSNSSTPYAIRKLVNISTQEFIEQCEKLGQQS